MSRFFAAMIVVIVSVADAAAECNCGYPRSCTTPCAKCAPTCTTPAPTTRELTPPVEERGAFAAPPRTGTTAGESRSLGIEGFGLQMPAMSIRMPTLQLPGLVRYRRDARMFIDSAEAPYVRDTMRELTIPRGNERELAERSLDGTDRNLIPPADNPTERGLPCARPLNAGDGADIQAPPIPKAVAIPHPGFGQLPSGTMQYVRDPVTGQIYQLTVQPVVSAHDQNVQHNQFAGTAPVQYTAQAQQYAAPAQQHAMPVHQYAAPVQQYAAPAQQYQVMPASITREVPTAQYPAAQHPAAQYPVAQYPAAVQPAVEQVQLQEALNASQRRQEELEAELRQVQSLVGRMAQQQSAPAPVQAPVAAPVSAPVVSQVPLHEVGGAGAISAETTSAEKPGLNRALRKLFAHAK